MTTLAKSSRVTADNVFGYIVIKDVGGEKGFLAFIPALNDYQWRDDYRDAEIFWTLEQANRVLEWMENPYDFVPWQIVELIGRTI